MALQKQKIMPPPWLAHREIERYSIGWRMGYGEDYIYRFGDWLDTLSPDEQTEYRTLFPEAKREDCSKIQRRGKPTNSALLESHYQSEHLQDIGMSRPICCYTSK